MPWQIARADLYRLIWSEPLGSAAKRFGVSDVAVAKACRRFAIPLPGRGHWITRARDRRLEKLPRAPHGVPDAIVFGSDGNGGGGPVRLWEPADPAPAAVTVPSLAEQRRRAMLLVGDVPVPYRSRRIQPMAARIGKEEGRSWEASEDAVGRRRLRLANAIFLAADRTGGRPQIPHDPTWLGVAIGRQLVRFKIDRLPAAGPIALRLEIQPYGEAWRDRGDNLLDYHLQEIVAELYVTADRAGRGEREDEQEGRGVFAPAAPGRRGVYL